MINIFTQNYQCKVPQSVNIDEILQSNPIKVSQYKNNHQRIKDNLAYLMSILYFSEVKNGKFNFHNLSSKVLKSVIRNYKEYLDYLEDMHILQKDNHYIKSRKSIGYKLTTSSDKVCNYYIYDTKMIKSITSSIKASQVASIASKHTFMTKYFDKIELDFVSFKQHYEQESDVEKLKRLDYIRTKFTNKDFNFTSDKAGRFYSIITMMPKETRKFLIANGMPLIEIDIKTSVPFFTLPLFNVSNWTIETCQIVEKFNPLIIQKVDSPRKDSLIYGSLNEEYTLIFKNQSTMNHIMWFKNGHRDDIFSYSSLITDNEKDLYGEFANLFTEKNLSKSTITRHDAKKKLLQIYNSPAHFKNKYKEVLLERFPTITAHIDWINTGFTKTKRMKRGHFDMKCPFSNIGFSLESCFVIENVMKTMSERHPEIPIFTVHDSFLVNSIHKSMLTDVIQNTEIKNTSFKPIMK